MNYTECIENARPRLGKILQRLVLNATAAHAKTRCLVRAQRASETQPYAITTNGNKSV